MIGSQQPDRAGALEPRSAFQAVAVQVRIDISDYASPDSFAGAMRRPLERYLRRRRDDLPVLLVYPEDVGLGLVVTHDYEQVRSCRTLQEAGRNLLARYTRTLLGRTIRARKHPLPALLALLSDQHVERIYRQTFARIAIEYVAYVCAGSAPIRLAGPDGEVGNVSYLFAPTGERIGVQHKTHLVVEEAEAGLHLRAATVDALGVFPTPFARIGPAICFDAFQPPVIDALIRQRADVLVQPAFNPKSWSEDQAAEWETGVWTAVQRTGAFRAGISAMMVGSLLNFAGEGRSAIIVPCDQAPDTNGYVARADSPTEETLLSAVIA